MVVSNPRRACNQCRSTTHQEHYRLWSHCGRFCIFCIEQQKGNNNDTWAHTNMTTEKREAAQIKWAKLPFRAYFSIGSGHAMWSLSARERR